MGLINTADTMKNLIFVLSMFFLSWPVQAHEKKENQVLLVCTKVSNDFISDISLNIPKIKSETDNYALIVWDGNADPYYMEGDKRATIPASVYLYDGKVHEFNASLTATLKDELTITSMIVRVFDEGKETWFSHGEFYAYNNTSGIYENVDYISALGRVYQLKTEPFRNKECESKFPDLNIVSDNENSTE